MSKTTRAFAASPVEVGTPVWIVQHTNGGTGSRSLSAQTTQPRTNLSGEGIDVGFLGSWNDDIRHALGRGRVVEVEMTTATFWDYDEWGEPADRTVAEPTGIVIIALDDDTAL